MLNTSKESSVKNTQLPKFFGFQIYVNTSLEKKLVHNTQDADWMP